MMNQMTMAGMNPGQGGPVGGGLMMMNNGTPATPSNGNTQDEMKQRLNTYIYDYFLNFGYHDHARALARDDKFEISTKNPVKSSPGRRKDGEVNGIDENNMDTDSKDDLTLIPDDLPRPQVPNDCPGNSFLFDWFCLFNDIFKAQRSRKPNSREMTAAHTYLEQTQVTRSNADKLRHGLTTVAGYATNARKPTECTINASTTDDGCTEPVRWYARRAQWNDAERYAYC